MENIKIIHIYGRWHKCGTDEETMKVDSIDFVG